MAKSGTTLSWCITRMGEDFQWWVQEISDEIHWDVDGLSIIDPRQLSHIMDLIEPLRDYDFQSELFEDAFYTFRIDKPLDENRLRLTRYPDTIADAEEPIFALPDIVDEDKSPYADLLDHVTRLRVKLLNDLIDFEQKLTVEELEDEIREEQNQHYMEGRSIHVFNELTNILEYVPAGYELEDDDTPKSDDENDIDEDFPDVDEDEVDEIGKDEQWDEDDEEEEAPELDDEEEDLDELEGDEEDD